MSEHFPSAVFYVRNTWYERALNRLAKAIVAWTSKRAYARRTPFPPWSTR